LRSRDFPTTQNYLRVNLCNIHDELESRIDVVPIVAQLLASDSQRSTPS
jgi:hypothetical protein